MAARERAMRWRIAAFLRRQAARLSPAQLRWLVVIFMAVGLTLYTWIGVRALSEPPAATRFLMKQVPAVPVGLRRRFDSLRAVRPGFADTIRRLERFYRGR